MKKVILLDLDGVLITTPSWKLPEFESDGFMKFNVNAARNLSEILTVSSAEIILTTTHRSSFSPKQWLEVFKLRNIYSSKVTAISAYDPIAYNRMEEIILWVDQHPDDKYVIIDDDNALNALPEKIKTCWVKTSALVGLDEEGKNKAIDLLQK